jgi:hypothetical protein
MRTRSKTGNYDIGAYEYNPSTTTAEFQAFPEINVYPVPASEYIIIENLSGQSSELFLYDITGRELFSSAISGKSHVNTGSFPPGIYLLRIRCADKTVSKRITIVR